MAIVSMRYARAGFDLACEKSGLDVLKSDAKTLLQAFAQNQDLLNTLSHPGIHADEKTSFLEALFKDKFCEDTLGLIKLLVAKGRGVVLPDVFSEILELIREYENIAVVDVVSAVPLSESQKKSLISTLEKRTGKHIELNPTLDESIIGGLVITFLGTGADMSLLKQLDNLERELLRP